MLFWKWTARLLAVTSIVLFLIGNMYGCAGLSVMAWLCRIEQKFRAMGLTSTFNERQP